MPECQQPSRYHRYGCEVEGGEGEGVTLPAGLFAIGTALAALEKQRAADAAAAAAAAEEQGKEGAS